MRPGAYGVKTSNELPSRCNLPSTQRFFPDLHADTMNNQSHILVGANTDHTPQPSTSQGTCS
ncbi:hypothetical protein E2C01_074160 [Portunus trituberculatus]|uniref:Uncharacterized protein n=1 Tax=Portunus trituberculatus TaxID=210409 RepID=A0A5B7IGE4_PORTR|nr:hypothetical protein [Portunus trituberculatus]